MTVDRVVVYDFEGTTVGAPFQSQGNYYPNGNYGDLYGGVDDLVAVRTAAGEPPLSPPVYATPGYQSTRSLELKFLGYDPAQPGPVPSSDSYPSYAWSDSWGYRPLATPPKLGRVCGMEVTFKVDPSVIRETLASVQLEVHSLSPNPAFSSVFWNFTSDPQYNGGGIWFAGATGKDTAGNPLGPGTANWLGDLTDTLHVDLTQWFTAKLLPTGEWSLAYAGGATILSGQLSPDVRDGGGYLGVAVDTSGRGRPPGDAGIPTGWIDNIVFWLNNPDGPVDPVPFPTYVTDGLSGDLLDTGQRFQ